MASGFLTDNPSGERRAERKTEHTDPFAARLQVDSIQGGGDVSAKRFSGLTGAQLRGFIDGLGDLAVI